MNSIEYALIWKEEQELLWNYSSKVPDCGTIVEIGTALGGTSRLMYEATKERNIKIYTIDVAPFQAAFDNLADTSVTILSKKSAEISGRWADDFNHPIDLLYIDGNHTLEGVFRDIQAWIPHLNPGSLIIFHDYDPSQRGGIAHLGVRVCLDTICRMNLIQNMRRDYKILAGTVTNPNSFSLSFEDCFSTLTNIANEIIEFRNKLFCHSISEGLDHLKEFPEGCDSLKACYCLEYAVKNDFEAVALTTSSTNDFRRWAETLYMFDHGFGSSPFPDQMVSQPAPSGIVELSEFVAREQVRVNILTMLLKSVASWNV